MAERRCKDCGADISDRGSRAYRCVTCQTAFSVAREKRRSLEGSRARGRKCLDCGADLTGKPGARKRCEKCAAEERIGWHQRRNEAAKHERIANSKSNYCIDCAADISDKHFNTERCDECKHQYKSWQARQNQQKARAKMDAELDARREGRTCDVCGGDMAHKQLGAKYCSEPCAQIVYRTQIAEKRARAEREPRYCLVCDEDISNTHGLRRYCSKQCKIEGGRQELNKRGQASRVMSVAPDVERTDQRCQGCGADISDKRMGTKWCKPCRDRVNREQQREVYHRDRATRPPRNCADCGEDISHTRTDRIHCDKCNRRPDNLNTHQNIAALRERDGDVCAWCGELVTAPYNGGETHVDHIRPFTRGGGSELANLQLLHATCNMSRGNKPMEEAPYRLQATAKRRRL